MVTRKPMREIELDAFALIREFDDTLEYMEKRIFYMRRKVAEIRKELIKQRPDFVGDD